MKQTFQKPASANVSLPVNPKIDHFLFKNVLDPWSVKSIIRTLHNQRWTFQYIGIQTPLWQVFDVTDWSIQP